MHLDNTPNDTREIKSFVKDEKNTHESTHSIKDEKITGEIKPDVKDQKKFSNCFYIGMLVVISQINLANFFVYDVPQSFQTPFREHFGINAQQTAALYSAYSFPNTILPIFGGLFINKYGEKIGALLFSLIIFIGQMVFTFGIWSNNYSLMLAGRVILGVGGENLYICEFIIVEKWFHDKNFSLCFGIIGVVVYCGTMLNNFCTPLLIGYLDNEFNVSVIIMLVVTWSNLACYLHVLLSLNYEQLLENNQSENDKERPTFQFSDLKYFRIELWLLFLANVTTCCAYYSFMGLITDFFQFKYEMSYEDAKFYASAIPGINAVLVLIFSAYTDKFGKKGIMLAACGLVSILAYILTYFFEVNGSNNFYVACIPVCMIPIFIALYESTVWSSLSLFCDLDSTYDFSKQEKKSVKKIQQARMEDDEACATGTSSLVSEPMLQRKRSNSVESIECLRKPKISGIAYGIAGTFQNIGLAIYPFIYGWINKEPSKDSYNKCILILLFKSIIGFILLSIVYIRDMRGRRVLDTPIHLQKK